jgi:glutamate transport system substrate-binding protein
MTEERDRFVDFAGPYQLVPQAVLVRRERTESLETIAGLSAPDVRVCTTTGSTSARTLREKEISADLVDTNEHCMAGMRSGTYDAYSTDLPILAGFLSQDPDTFEILELAIADHSEQIGIGVPDGDVALRDLINYFLDHWQQGPEVASPWLRAYDRTIGPYLGPVHRAQPRVVDPPELADYDSRAPRRP